MLSDNALKEPNDVNIKKKVAGWASSGGHGKPQRHPLDPRTLVPPSGIQSNHDQLPSLNYPNRNLTNKTDVAQTY